MADNTQQLITQPWKSNNIAELRKSRKEIMENIAGTRLQEEIGYLLLNSRVFKPIVVLGHYIDLSDQQKTVSYIQSVHRDLDKALDTLDRIELKIRELGEKP